MPPVPGDPISNFPTWSPTVGPAPGEAVIRQAMQMLGTQIGVLTGAVNKNTAAMAGGRGGGGGVGIPGGGGATNFGVLTAPLMLLAGKVAAVVGPLAILGAMLQSQTSGFEVFLTTGKMLGVVLGALLMPAFVALAGATYAAAIGIDQALTPQLERLFTVTLKGFGVAMEGLTDYLNTMARTVATLIDVFTSGIVTVVNTVNQFAVGIQQMLGRFGVNLPAGPPLQVPAPGQKGEVGGGDFGNGPPAGRPGPGSGGPNADALGGLVGGVGAGANQSRGFMSEMVKGMRMAVQSMQMAVVGQPHYTAGEQMYKEATLAGIGKDPFEAKMLEIMLKQLEAMNKVVGKLQPAVEH